MQKFLRMARLALLLFLSSFFSFIAYLPMSFTAKADEIPQRGDYACVLFDDVFFYADTDAAVGLFLLPKSYYVRLLDYTDTLCRVEYQTDDTQTQRLVGYVKTADLVFVPYIPRRPYLRYVFDVQYKLQDATQTSNGFLTQITMTCSYYGDYTVGATTYCYVLREGEFGYVPKPTEFRYEENTEYAEYLETLKAQSSEETENGKRSSPIQIGILIVLCLLVPLLAALILKTPRTPPYDPTL